MDISSSLELLLLRGNRLVGYVCTVYYKAAIRLLYAVFYSLDVYIVFTTAATTGVNI